MITSAPTRTSAMSASAPLSQDKRTFRVMSPFAAACLAVMYLISGR